MPYVGRATKVQDSTPPANLSFRRYLFHARPGADSLTSASKWTMERHWRLACITAVILILGCGVPERGETIVWPQVNAPAQSAAKREPKPPFARLRIHNVGVKPIRQLVVAFPEYRVYFGDVEPSQTTEYQDIPTGVYYHGAFGHLWQGREFPPFTIDWVGERPVQGTFTYDVELRPYLHVEYVHFIQRHSDR